MCLIFAGSHLNRLTRYQNIFLGGSLEYKYLPIFTCHTMKFHNCCHTSRGTENSIIKLKVSSSCFWVCVIIPQVVWEKICIWITNICMHMRLRSNCTQKFDIDESEKKDKPLSNRKFISKLHLRLWFQCDYKLLIWDQFKVAYSGGH